MVTARGIHLRDEEYIVRAIEEGFDFYGVSDHVMFPTLNQPGIRGGYEKDFEKDSGCFCHGRNPWVCFGNSLVVEGR